MIGMVVSACSPFHTLPGQHVEGVGVSDTGLHAVLVGHLDDGGVALAAVGLRVMLEGQPGDVPLLETDQP